jgi:hypothetical protein
MFDHKSTHQATYDTNEQRADREQEKVCYKAQDDFCEIRFSALTDRIFKFQRKEGLKQDDADRIVCYRLSKDNRKESRALLVFQLGNSSDSVRWGEDTAQNEVVKDVEPTYIKK